MGDNKDDKPVCEQPIFTGPCRAMYPKFGFDGKNCVPFMYGGCMGNQNNFGSEEQCRQRCMMQNDAAVEEEEEEEEEEVKGKGQSLIMSREAIREAKKRERQAERKKSGKNGKKAKNNNSGKKSAGKKNQNNKNIRINNRSNNRVKGLSKSEEDEMRFN